MADATIHPGAVVWVQVLLVLAGAFLLNVRFVRSFALEVVLVAALTSIGARLAILQFNAGAGSHGELFLGLVALVGAPLAWIEFRSKARAGRLNLLVEVQRAFTENRDLQEMSMYIYCYHTAIDGRQNPIRELLEEVESGRRPMTSGDVALYVKLDMFIMEVDHRCLLRTRGLVERTDFDSSPWPYMALQATDPAKNALCEYVRRREHGWSDLVQVADEWRLRELRARERSEARTSRDRVRLWLRHRREDLGRALRRESNGAHALVDSQ